MILKLNSSFTYWSKIYKLRIVCKIIIDLNLYAYTINYIIKFPSRLSSDLVHKIWNIKVRLYIVKKCIVITADLNTSLSKFFNYLHTCNTQLFTLVNLFIINK